MLRIAIQHLRAGAAHDALAAVGVAVAVACFTFLLALGLGIRALALHHVHPEGMVEVAKTRTTVDLWAFRIGFSDGTLDDDDLARIRGMDGVAEAFPRFTMAAPAVATGGEGLLGAGLTTELLMDGLPPSLLAAELDHPERFHDPGERLSQQLCGRGQGCPDGQYCAPAWWPAGGTCQTMIPVVVSPSLVEIFNSTVRQAYGTPELRPEAAIGLTLDVAFGRSTLGGRSKGRVERGRIQLVGYSRWAIPLGVSMPGGWVDRLNQQIAPERSPVYRSAVVRPLEDGDLAAVVSSLRGAGFEPVERAAERAAALLGALLAAVAVAGIAVVAVAGTHITHVFLMHVVVRARELALMRSVGARRGDIVAIILWQAMMIGTTAGVVGVGVAVALGTVTDRYVLSAMGALQLRPDSLFVFPWWLVAGGVVAATLTCVGGALLPAVRAARIDPASALRGS